MVGKLKLGQLLVAQELIHPDQLAAALAAQQENRGRLGTALVAMGAIAEEDLIRVLAKQLGVQVARIGGKTVSAEIVGLLPGDVAEKHRCLPLFLRDDTDGEVLVVGMEDPSDDEALLDIRRHTGCRAVPVLIGPTELEAALARYYPARPVDAPEDPLIEVVDWPPLPKTPEEPGGRPPAAVPSPLPPTDWMEAEGTDEPLASADPRLDLAEEPSQNGKPVPRAERASPEAAAGAEAGDPADALFDGDEPVDIGSFAEPGETFDPLTLDEAPPGAADDSLDSLEVTERPLAPTVDPLAALDASFGGDGGDAGDQDSLERIASLGLGDPDASWSELAQDPSVADDPFGGEDPFAEFEKEPFASSDAPILDEPPTDPIREPLPAPAPPDDAARQAAILQALAQLLVEKGVIGRKEFAARLRKLTGS